MLKNKPNYLEIGTESDNLMEHLGVVEDERNALLNEKEELYEVAVGDNGINRYTHEELIILLTEMQDCYEWVCNFKSMDAMRADLKQLRGE